MKALDLLITAPVIPVCASVWTRMLFRSIFPFFWNPATFSDRHILDAGPVWTRMEWLEGAHNSASTDYHIIILTK